ncbi:MAG: hypothetical protein ACKVTZ_11090 [Bacteroidia bacterium]
MKQKLLSFALLLGCFFSAFAQLPSVSLSEKKVNGKMGSVIVYIGQNKSGYFIVRYLAPVLRKPKVLIQKFDKDMNPLKEEVEIETEVDTKGSTPYYQEVIWLGDKLHLFTVQYGKKGIIFYRQVIDPDNFKVSDPIEVAQVNSPYFSLIGGSNASNSSMKIRISPDSSKILLAFLPSIEKNANVAVRMQVWDNSLETKLWDKEVVMKFTERLGDIENIKVDDNGSAYILSTQYRDVPKEKVRKLPNYDFILTACTSLGDDIVHQKIQVKDKFVNDIGFTVQPNGDVLCVGFFSPNNTYNLKGTCLFKFNPQTGETLEAGYDNFPENFLAQYQDGKEVTKKDELGYHDIDRVIPEANGDVTVIAEQAYTYTTSTYVTTGRGTGYYKTIRHYVNNNIIVFRYNAEGKLRWIQKIPKRQHTTDDGGIYIGYRFLQRGDNLIFIYGDNAQNSLEDPKKVKSYPPGLFGASNAVLSMVTINPDGKMKRDELINLREEGFYPLIKLAHNNRNKELIFVAAKNFTVRMGNVKWK